MTRPSGELLNGTQIYTDEHRLRICEIRAYLCPIFFQMIFSRIYALA
jgi:hypothetical protein